MYENPLRSTPLTFDEWIETFTVEDEEDRLALASAVKRYLGDPVFLRVIGEIERAAIRHLVDCSVDPDTVLQAKYQVRGVRALRVQLKAWEAELELRKSQSE